jgi:alpha-tubulin suppressor-like RCC1 family protein
MPGADAGSELGAPIMACSATPVPVAGLPGPVTAIAAGYTHTCALAGGGVWCWGNDSAGQLGNGKQGTTSAVPVQVMGLEAGVDAIAAGGTLTCALTGGRVLCWGSDGATTGSLTPRDVGLAAADAISVGSVFACAISAGAMSCWGSDADGELGDGMAMTARATPAPVSGLATEVKLVAAGWRHACAVQATSTVCWGANDSGQIGDGSMETRSVPVAVARLPGPPEKLAGGESNTCAVASGKVYCWGGSPVAPLSVGDDAGSVAPAEVDGLPL